MNLLALVRDARDILFLRFAPAEEYRYAPPVLAAALAAIGITQAVSMMPMLGQGGAALAFGVAVGVLKWLVLSRAVHAVFRYFGAAPQSFYGYALAGELLTVPSLAVLYFPEAASVASIWLAWGFAAQTVGFARVGQQPLYRVFLAYVVYLLAMVLVGAVLFGVFAGAGWLNPEHIRENLQTIMDNSKL